MIRRHATALALVLTFAPACGGSEPESEAYRRAEIQAAQNAGFDWWTFFEDLFSDIWQSVCDQWETIRQMGVRAFCDAYLDRMGVPERGIKRTIGRTVCMRKVNEAIDDAVCSIIDVLTPPTAEPADEAPAEPADGSGDAPEETPEETPAGPDGP